MSVTLEFTNTFDMTLKRVKIRLEGPGDKGLKTQFYK